jgi:L-serine dehydratase
MASVMESIRELYRIGRGPSSSHTMGPNKAATQFRQRHPQVKAFRVHLFASLALTGRGHMTDVALQDAFHPLPVEILWKPEIELDFHPNGMWFDALNEDGSLLERWEVFSVGGGALQEASQTKVANPVYDLTKMADILSYSINSGKTFWEYVEEREGPQIWGYLDEVWTAMQAAIERGLETEGILPGGLGLPRKASSFERQVSSKITTFFSEGHLPAYALAVAEENAGSGVVVTAPTCGSCGVLPAILRHVKENVNSRPQAILCALATAGLIGNLVKFNASISGAEVGCQGEIGVACAMASAAAAQLLGGSPRQIEYAASMGLEHHLGLTCDPVKGLVQIPCIERNVFAATRAINCARYACYTDGSHRISFDQVVQVMKETGHDLPSLYRETSTGGLATIYSYPPIKRL